jgi:hypothetical protein
MRRWGGDVEWEGNRGDAGCSNLEDDENGRVMLVLDSYRCVLDGDQR